MKEKRDDLRESISMMTEENKAHEEEHSEMKKFH